MNSKSKPSIHLSEAIALLSCALGCIHVALVIYSGFTFWPASPIELLGGLFGTVGVLIYFIMILTLWMCAGLFVGLLVTHIKRRKRLG